MRVDKGTPMSEVFKHYAERKGVNENGLTFARRRRGTRPRVAPRERRARSV